MQALEIGFEVFSLKFNEHKLLFLFFFLQRI